MSWAKVAVAAMAVGTGMQAWGQYQTGRSQQAMFNYNAQVQARNAQIARDKAAFAEKKHKMDVFKAKGAARTAYAKAGVELDTGTVLDTGMELAMLGELDRLAILYEGETEATAAEIAGAGERFKGSQAYAAGVRGAVGTILTGGAQTYGTGQSLGVFG